MHLPFPKPISRSEARTNAIHFAEEANRYGLAKGASAELCRMARAWAAIAETFDDEHFVMAVNEAAEESFEDWARRQIEKHGYILQETMNRVDRLEPVTEAMDEGKIADDRTMRQITRVRSFMFSRGIPESVIDGVVNAILNGDGLPD